MFLLVVCLLVRPTARKRLPFKSTDFQNQALFHRDKTHTPPTFPSDFRVLLLPKTFYSRRASSQTSFPIVVHLRAEIIENSFLIHTAFNERLLKVAAARESLERSSRRCSTSFYLRSLSQPFCDRRVEKYARCLERDKLVEKSQHFQTFVISKRICIFS